jgi:hypothetical protein
MALVEGDLVELSWRGLAMSQAIITTRKYILRGGGANPANTVYEDLANILLTVDVGGASDMTTAYLDTLPTNYALYEIRAQLVYPTRSSYLDLQKPAVAGTEGAAALVPNDASVITFRTAKAGRDQVANVHIGPLPTDAVAAGVLTGPYLALLSTLGGKFATAFQPVGWIGALKPTIFHKASATDDEIIDYTVWPQSRVMVRRTLNRGS